MKKIGYSILLAIIMVFTTFTPVYADNTSLTQNEISIINEIKEFDPSFTYEGELISASKISGYLTDDGNFVMPQGSIGNQNMSIYITVSRIQESGKDSFGITATARWLNVPTIRATDAFAIGWGGDFAHISSYATASYKSLGIVDGKTSMISAAANRGVGYSVSCSHYYGQALDWVRIYAKISQIDRSGIANVVASYCHTTLSIGVNSITYAQDGSSIGFSVSGASDTLSNITNFSY